MYPSQLKFTSHLMLTMLIAHAKFSTLIRTEESVTKSRH